ncbi:hypothetical protein AND_007322 [Anopheles darlingi]|uniref:Uncharacterized protein n=1 Tax=Anopheles darlingi TaxID=43151 RepID=W5J9A3_ANODA|nr:hypothetical protein AND_007322 [Anopheles darlingi]
MQVMRQKGANDVTNKDPDISTHKPIAPDTEQGGNGGAGNGGDGGNVGDDGNGAAGDDENAIFEQMEKKAKSYRLKLYKKHKNFKHTHHHRGGLYHQPYHTFHHDYYRRKMLERERERWKKMQDAKPDYQGQISYYENSNKLATNEDILAHLNGGHGGGGSGGSGSSSSQEKWPNFDRVMSSLKTEPKPDNVPPYIKKYNRRNKQLIDLLEGTIAPLSDYSVHKHRERKYHRRKNPHWMEEDLFEEQRPSQSKGSGMQRNYIQETIQSSTIHSNALPGEGIHIIYDKKHGVGDHDDLEDGSHLMYGRPTISSGHGHDGGVGGGGGGFVYHRVASPQPLGGVGGYGRLKRQRLPFVAITDRRLSAPPKRRPAANNGGPNNPLLNHQPEGLADPIQTPKGRPCHKIEQHDKGGERLNKNCKTRLLGESATDQATHQTIKDKNSNKTAKRNNTIKNKEQHEKLQTVPANLGAPAAGSVWNNGLLELALKRNEVLDKSVKPLPWSPYNDTELEHCPA